MSATKILWGQITAVFLIVLTAIWSATQWTASALAYQPELGAPWFMVGDWAVYPPPAFFWWWFSFDAYAPDIFQTGAYIAVSGGFVSIAVAIAMSVWRARELKNAETYGSARWASEKEIRKAGLLGDNGVVLGQFGRTYLRHDGPEHVLCYAPTRSGKGVGLVVPSLLTWPGSAIIHDIKGENWTLTAGFRSRHGRVLLFDPTNPLSAAYNPLLEVRRGQWEVRDVQNVADVLVDPEGSLERRNHWEKTSHSLLVGAILHVLYAEPDKTLAGVAAFLSDPARPIETTLDRMMATPHLGEAGVHPVIASAARELLNKSDNERSGVLSTAMSFLGLYRDPVVAEVTRCCQWRIADLVEGPEPVTLYLVVPPSDISRTRPLIRLMLNQIGRRLTEELDSATKRHRLLMMLDEFAALGRLDFFEKALAFVAGYGLKAFLIAQSLNQVEQAYGPNNAILDNCHIRVSFATNDERTGERVSKALGTATEMKAMKNYAGHRLSPWLGHLMVSRSETARQLLTQGEVMTLPPDEEIVMVSGIHPIRAKKAAYYADPRLAARIMAPPDPAAWVNRETRPDDWRNLPPIAPDDAMMRAFARRREEAKGIGQPKGGKAKADEADGEKPDSTGESEAATDIRQEPEQERHLDIAPKPRPAPSNEFDPDEPESDADAIRNREIQREQAMNARRASMDRDDGIEL